MSVLWVPRVLFKGKGSETPFLFCTAGAHAGFHTFFRCKDKIQLPFTFQLPYRGSSLCSETAASSKNTFKLFLTVPSSASSCLYFRESTACRSRQNPSSPQIPQAGMSLCVTLAGNVSVLAQEQQPPAQRAKPSQRGKAPLPVLPCPWHGFLLLERIRKSIPLG